MNIATLGLVHSAARPSQARDDQVTPAGQTSHESASRDFRQLVGTELSAFLAKETDQRHRDWCSALESLKAALVGLERTCEAEAVKLSENPPASAAAIAELVESFVAAAARDRAAAIQRVQADAQAEIARLESLTARLSAEVLAEREQARSARAEAETLRDARERAQAECEEAKGESARIAAAFSVQSHELRADLQRTHDLVAQLRREVDAGHAERARLLAAVQAVQRAVSFNEPVTAAQAPAVEDLFIHSNQAIEELETRASADDAPHPEELLDPGVSAQIDGLFADIEQMYYADLEAKRQPTDVVDRLIANLDYAYTVLCQSSRSGEPPGALFERRMMGLVDAKAQTNFARHLSIAAYQWTQQHTPAR
jgi:hypothetical protein